MADKEASIIIKKIKKGGHGGHHGGAWKVAYADFVTAMMAFFLLLWLLQATAQSQKEGIAEYFTPTIGVRDEAGIGFKGGQTSYDEGRKVAEKSPPGIMVGRMPQGPVAQKQEHQSPVESTQDSYLFEKGERTIKQAMEEDPNFRDFKDNVIVEQSPEGLKIELIDDDKLPMFEPKGTQLTQAGEKILRKIAQVIKEMPNRISITGHTEATNYAQSAQYTNWELTADRANAARRFLMTTNMEPNRVAKVTGRADQELLDPKNPTSSRNRRVTIVLLRASYLTSLGEQSPAPPAMLTVPKPTDALESEVAKPAPKPAAPPKPVPTDSFDSTPATHVDKSNADSLPTDFKMPTALRRSMDQLPAGATPDGSKANDSLDSLPSGLINTNGQ
jgi:chemotaxis protein MotB